MEQIADANRDALIKGGLRSLAAAFPIAGAFAQLWNECESHTKNQRLDEFFKNLHVLVARMQGELDAVRESMDEFPALFEMTVEKVQKEFSARKRGMLAQALLSNLAAGAARSYDDKVNIIDALDALNETDLLVLNKFSSGASIRVSAMTENGGEPDEQELSVLAVSLSKLESRALVAETRTYGESLLHDQVDYHWTANWPAKKFQLMPFGKSLLDSLKGEIMSP